MLGELASKGVTPDEVAACQRSIPVFPEIFDAIRHLGNAPGTRSLHDVVIPAGCLDSDTRNRSWRAVMSLWDTGQVLTCASCPTQTLSTSSQSCKSTASGSCLRGVVMYPSYWYGVNASYGGCVSPSRRRTRTCATATTFLTSSPTLPKSKGVACPCPLSYQSESPTAVTCAIQTCAKVWRGLVTTVGRRSGVVWVCVHVNDAARLAGKIVREWLASTPESTRVVYVGDGGNDFCPARCLRGYVNAVVLVMSNWAHLVCVGLT